MVVVSPLGEFVVVIAIRTLHVAWAAFLINGAAVVRAIDRDHVTAVQPVVDVHAALDVMHIAGPPVGTHADSTAASGSEFPGVSGSDWSRASDRRMGSASGKASGPANTWLNMRAGAAPVCDVAPASTIGYGAGAWPASVWAVGGRTTEIRLIGGRSARIRAIRRRTTEVGMVGGWAARGGLVGGRAACVWAIH